MTKPPFFDKDLSWLSFNYRILLEAQKSHVPLLNRLRFLAIYSSNLDEFYRVRVANLKRLVSIGKKKINKELNLKPETILEHIYDNLECQLEEYGACLSGILEKLAQKNIFIHQNGIESSHLSELEWYFKTKILAFLCPKYISINKHPFLKNRALYFGLQLKKNNKIKYAVLNIPSDQIPRFYAIQTNQAVHYYFIDDIIKQFTRSIFPGYEVLECHSFKLNKDADLQIDDEYSGDLVSKIEKQVKKRDLGDPSRFLYDKDLSPELLNIFKDQYNLSEEDLAPGGKYHNLNDFFEIKPLPDSDLLYETLTPVFNKDIDAHDSLFKAIDEQDQILHFPYQSYDYILKFFNEASIDPDVDEINVTFYRMASESMIGNALISAAINGKKVNVFMEVKARFDEENNIQWAEKMRKAGVKIRYSMPGLKVHAKVALVRKNINGKIGYYGFFGTGNLNETTAKLYCDHGLLTRHPEMTEELNNVFRFLLNKETPVPFNHLIVSQFGALQRFTDLIENEIQNCRQGKKAQIIVKLNNLEEPNLIKKLYEAAAAGVEVKLLVRSICCMVPGTEDIEISRIVDRYLEHARLFYFYNDTAEDLFVGSSDWMNRNIHRRVEVTFPIYDKKVKAQLLQILNIQLEDNTNRVLLSPDLHNISIVKTEQEKNKNAQLDTYYYLKELNS